MAEMATKKIFAGPRIRRLRRELGLSQSQMASELGFSTSYLNLVERNQRPVSAQFLLRLAEVYDVELTAFAGTDEARAFADLSEILADPMFKSLGLSRGEVQDMADAAPKAVDAFSLLYKSFRQARQSATELSSQFVERDATDIDTVFPVDEVRDFIHDRKNYFPELDEVAESLHEEIGLNREDAFMLLSARLDEEHGIRVRIMPYEVMPDTLRHFDLHRRQLLISEMIDMPARLFQLAFQLAMLEMKPMIQRIGDSHTFQTEEARRLVRISLANYFAGALLMPYGRFLKEAKALKYDMEQLGRRFGTSFEQVAHRLTTLQRPGERGIPFFFIRVDKAGNVSKRYSAGRFHFSRFGGTCPLWSVHDTFATPGRIVTQAIQMPDETTYFSVARTVKRVSVLYGQPEQQLAIGLGCDIAHARELVYAKSHNLEAPDATPIGPNCRLCERPNCAQRAHPPLTKNMVLDERSRGVSAYRFSSE
ncbi:helix-turn-helix domain-containing protein [Kordiimonas marina]|uniref:helix-turn-helix domain-containing protein n=1 Tax=Kordiimonas marina TaxID=2872312 RepID=UPI001FF14D61|nr:helix-turn-helix domain-containing protein [Kordiimonas marina]MCJ9429989.1 short-chain fatty acyl-CoA regulator family protein [Kordiimonas marina]